MSTKTTYVLSKEEIVSRLENMHFSFEEHHWESFQQKFAEVNVQQTSTSTTKFSPKLIAIPACIVLAGIIVYFSVNKLQSQNNTGNTKINIETAAVTLPAKPAEIKPAPVKTAEVPENKTPVPVANGTTTVATKAIPAPQQTTAKSVQPNTASITVPVTLTSKTVSTTPSNTAKVSSVPAMKNQGTTVPQQPVKRFYKKKTDAQTIPQQLVPSPGEDDVVVPEGESGTAKPEN